MSNGWSWYNITVQNLAGNLTTFMFNHNGFLTFNDAHNKVRVVDFQSNGKEPLNGSSTTRGDPAKQHLVEVSAGS